MSRAEGKFAEVFDTLEKVEEAFVLLDLINTEFQTDLQSVQCFDSRIVDRVNKLMIWKREMFDA